VNIRITATCESFEQAQKLLENGVDCLYLGEGEFGLRLPSAFSLNEIRELTALAHVAGKFVTIAVNALMHVEKMAKIRDYLSFLSEILTPEDHLAVGDAGVIYVLQEEFPQLHWIYDASTMVASARQVNFWAKQGASGAVLARELPKPELEAMSHELEIPGEILVYGATVIHQSKRPLLQNYFNFAQVENGKKDQKNYHFLAEPSDENSHYSIFEDAHGTHIFANDDLNMMTALPELLAMGYDHWKLDGIFTRGDAFVEIVKCFVEARQMLETGSAKFDEITLLDEKVRKLHPANRTLSRGFYDLDPKKIK
jgi:collagenase-like PrtC family protease